MKHQPLTPHRKQYRLKFCPSRTSWIVADWLRVIFSNEPQFSLSDQDHRIFVWRRVESVPTFIYERHTAIIQGVAELEAICTDTQSALVVLQGTITTQSYGYCILNPVVLRMPSTRSGAIYQQDNALPCIE